VEVRYEDEELQQRRYDHRLLISFAGRTVPLNWNGADRRAKRHQSPSSPAFMTRMSFDKTILKVESCRIAKNLDFLHEDEI